MPFPQPARRHMVASTDNADLDHAPDSDPHLDSDLGDGDNDGDDIELSPTDPGPGSLTGNAQRPARASEGLPIKMMHDRILVQIDGPDGDRKSTGGILIPATAQVGKRLTWAEVVAAGPSVRSMELGDRVLFNPEDRYEVEVGGRDYIILRERDIHAVAAERLDDSPMGLYL